MQSKLKNHVLDGYAIQEDGKKRKHWKLQPKFFKFYTSILIKDSQFLYY
jgi:hypothetical protein